MIVSLYRHSSALCIWLLILSIFSCAPSFVLGVLNPPPECKALLQSSSICKNGSKHGISYVRYEKTGSSSVHGTLRVMQKWLAMLCRVCYPLMPVRSGDHTSVDILTEHGPSQLVTEYYFSSSEVRGPCGLEVIAPNNGGAIMNANRVNPSVLLVTVMRHPRSKFWSSFFYFGARGMNQQDLDAVGIGKLISDMQWSDIPARLASRYVRSLGRVFPPPDFDPTGQRDIHISSVAYFRSLNESTKQTHVHRACETLKQHFDVVSTTDDMASFFGRISIAMSLPDCAIARLRSNDLNTQYTMESVDKLPGAIHAAVQAMIVYDNQVFECAQEVARKQEEDLSVVDATRMAEFRRNWNDKIAHVTR